MDAALARRVLQEAARQRIDCLYFLPDHADPDSARAAADAGFFLTDKRLTFKRSLSTSALADRQGPRDVNGLSIRDATTDDLPALRAIARVSHHDSRFYNDTHFARERCDELYETWIENSIAGFAKCVYTAEVDEAPLGYITCDTSRDGTGSIGLLAVAPAARGRGIGSRLLERALERFVADGCHAASVVTQGRNSGSRRLYESCGFSVAIEQDWYHCWPNETQT
jgi:dTDP-4-amino-4,6-dideoxy-D-galactose acyltransferase